MQKEMVSGH